MFKILGVYNCDAEFMVAKEQAKKDFTKYIQSDFSQYITQYGLTDQAFKLVYLAGYKIGIAEQVVARTIDKLIRFIGKLEDPTNSESGDGVCSWNKKDIEIKTSSNFDGNRMHFQVKRIRFHYKVDYFILNFFDAPTDEMWWLYIPRQVMFDFGPKYDCYQASTTGTPSSNANNQDLDRQLSICPNSKLGSKQHSLWMELQQYRYSLSSLADHLLGESAVITKFATPTVDFLFG